MYPAFGSLQTTNRRIIGISPLIERQRTVCLAHPSHVLKSSTRPGRSSGQHKGRGLFVVERSGLFGQRQVLGSKASSLWGNTTTSNNRSNSHITHAGVDSLAALGTDFLLFLGATVLVVPVFKSAKQSPVLGYLFAGVLMGQLGLFRNVEEIEKLSELGVLFLLFEMGLELSLDKLRSLAKYAFGLGSLQMGLTTFAFVAVALPPGHGFMTWILEHFLRAAPSLAEIRTVDEAVVIAVALSLSSSAFVLQLLKERGELESKFGQATLGILLFQDIATVPFLVLLPLIEGNNSIDLGSANTMSLVQELVPTILKTLGGLGLVLLGGRTVLRRVFEVVAGAQAEEVFIALCLLTVTGASLLTQRLGFSDTLGAFVSGVLLSETNFKAQVEADIQPFRGLLLGLFFVTTGSSLDIALLIREWPIVLALLAGLLALKTTLISLIGPSVGLTRAESIRTGFVLSQGGEFAFVLLALASQLNVLPVELNKLLIIVVVLSMIATPLLTETGKRVAEFVSGADAQNNLATESIDTAQRPVLVCGFGEVGQTVANMLDTLTIPYVAFDLTVPRVQAAQDAGFNVLYGDGSRSKVLHAAGVEEPRAVVVGYTARARAVSAVAALHAAYPDVPIMARAIDIRHAAELESAGATEVVCSEAEAGLAVGRQVIEALGVKNLVAASLSEAVRDDMMSRSHELAVSMEGGEGGPQTTINIYKYEGPTSAAWTAAGSGSADEEDAGGLLASLLRSAALPLAASSDGVGLVIDMERPQMGNGNGGVAMQSMEGDSMVVVPSAGGKELPDGSKECPVDWDTMTSIDEDENAF